LRGAGLVGVGGRRNTKRGRLAAAAPAADLVGRGFTADRPNELWVADITELDTAEGWLRLAGVLDVCAQKLVGWSMSRRAAADLVVDAVVMAGRCQQVEGPVTHHSGKGTQHTSPAFTDSLEAHGVAASFGSTGDCYDNARMESFWATVKRVKLAARAASRVTQTGCHIRVAAEHLRPPVRAYLFSRKKREASSYIRESDSVRSSRRHLIGTTDPSTQLARSRWS